jgi:hypothetical protein
MKNFTVRASKRLKHNNKYGDWFLYAKVKYNESEELRARTLYAIGIPFFLIVVERTHNFN